MTTIRNERVPSLILAPAALLAMLMAGLSTPAQAADGCCGEMLRRLNAITDAVDKLNVANNRGQKTTADQDRRIADYGSQTTSDLLKQQSKTDAMLDYSESPDYQCATATLAQSDPQREVKGKEAMSVVDTSLATLFTDDNSGNSIYQKRIFNAACKLGAIGNSETDRHGKSCQTAADPKLKGRDVSLASAVINDPCIPLDPPKVAQEFQKIVTQDDYSSSDPNNKEALLALIVMHRFYGTNQERYPRDAAFENSKGLIGSSLMTDSLARRYAQNGALLTALDYHACYSKSYMQGCDKGESQARQYFSDYGINESINLPPGGYCLSKYQLDIAKTIKDMETQKNYLSGDDAVKVTAYATLEQAIQTRTAKAKAIDDAAAVAAGAKNGDVVNPENVRPVTAESSRDLIDAVRKLTRALETAGDRSAPHSVPVKGAAPRVQGDGVLLPLASDYPVLHP